MKPEINLFFAIFGTPEAQDFDVCINQALRSLNPREEMVIRMRFGIKDNKIKTLKELGEDFGVTRERIRQIEAKALRRLKYSSKKRLLEKAGLIQLLLDNLREIKK